MASYIPVFSGLARIMTSIGYMPISIYTVPAPSTGFINGTDSLANFPANHAIQGLVLIGCDFSQVARITDRTTLPSDVVITNTTNNTLALLRDGSTIKVSIDNGSMSRYSIAAGTTTNPTFNAHCVVTYLVKFSDGKISLAYSDHAYLNTSTIGGYSLILPVPGVSYGFVVADNYTGSSSSVLLCSGSAAPLFTFINNTELVPIPTDPYEPGGTSGPGGGNGTFDFTSTDIPIPPLPTIGAYDTGFISLYRPTDSELRALAAYLWSGPFDLDNFKKIFANPMDCILGLHIIPTAGAHPVGSTSALMVGNISTGLSMQRLGEQYFELDCGTITIDPKWGAYLDYSPYSKLSLFLPYIGFVTISPDDCMNGTIRVVYHVDVLSGSCCAYVYCTSNQGADGHTLYTFTGGCACDCPVTEGQYTNGLFGSLRGGIGLAAGLLSASPAGIMGGIEEAANAALSMVKPDVGRSGSFGGSAGLMGIQYPYLVLTIPKMCTPGDQNIYRGYPSFVTEELGNVSGYASVEITHMENMSATDDEVSEIMGLLGEGVIF